MNKKIGLSQTQPRTRKTWMNLSNIIENLTLYTLLDCRYW
jgi:hypothetical protein